MKINIIDLFSGCGGLTDGFLQTGMYNTLAAVDWEAPTIKTLRHRLFTKWGYENSDKFIHFDIQRTEELLNGFNDEKYGESEGLIDIINGVKVDIVIGGPPCQAYSIAGRVKDKNGMNDDYRNFLFESYVKVVDYFKPKAFVFENVEGILSACPGGVSIVDRIRSSFLDIGYEITSDLRKNALFDTSFYGVPQRRKRVIIYGVLKNESSSKKIEKFYSLIKSFKSDVATNSKEAFDSLPKIIPLRTPRKNKVSHKIISPSSSFPENHEPRFHNARDIKIFKILTKDILSGKNKYSSTSSLIELYKKHTGKNSKFHKYHVIREDKPSNTIPAHLHKDGLRHIHPDPKQARSITVREAARIQTFSDDFVFMGPKGSQYKMIGNAVPPLFSKLIAKAIIKLEN